MYSKTIEKSLKDFREVIETEIRKVLDTTPSKILPICVEFPTSYNEDRVYTLYCTAIFIDADTNDVMIESHTDYDEDNNADHIDLFSVDELLDIVKAI